MLIKNNVLQNSVILVTQQIVINVLSIFMVGYTARMLGKEDYGIFSLAFAFPVIFLTMGHLGLRAFTVREIAGNPENMKLFLGKIVPVRVASIMTMGIITIIIAYFLNYSEAIMIAIGISTCSLIFDNLSKIILDVFHGVQKMGSVAYRDIVVRLFTGILSIVTLYYGYGLYEVCFVYAIGSLFGLTINIFLYYRVFGIIKFHRDLSFISDSIKESYPFILIGLSSILLMKTDIVIISKILDPNFVGIYSVAVILFYRISLVCDAIGTAVFPSIANLYSSDQKAATKVLENSISITLILAIPISVGGYLLADDIITLIYGNRYQGSVKIFSILICGMPFMFLSTLFKFGLGAVKQQKYVMYILIILSILNGLFNIILLNSIGISGAAITTLIIQVILFIMLFYKIVLYFKIAAKWRLLFSISTASTFMGLGLMVYRVYPIYISIPTGAIIYLVSLLLIGGSEIEYEKYFKILVSKK